MATWYQSIVVSRIKLLCFLKLIKICIYRCLGQRNTSKKKKKIIIKHGLKLKMIYKRSNTLMPTNHGLMENIQKMYTSYFSRQKLKHGVVMSIQETCHTNTTTKKNFRKTTVRINLKVLEET